MIDAANILILAPCHVASAFEFLRKVLRSFAPTGSSERDELARHKRQKRSVLDQALASFVVNEVVD